MARESKQTIPMDEDWTWQQDYQPVSPREELEAWDQQETVKMPPPPSAAAETARVFAQVDKARAARLGATTVEIHPFVRSEILDMLWRLGFKCCQSKWNVGQTYISWRG